MEAYASDFERLGLLLREKEILDSNLDKLMDRWMHLSSKSDN